MIRTRRREVTALLAAAGVIVGCAAGAEERETSSASTPTAGELAVFRVTTGTREHPAGRRDIVVIGRAGRRQTIVVGESKSGPRPRLFDRPAWSPDGRRLAVTIDLDATEPGVRRSEIFLVNADGSGLRRLTTAGRAFAPVWSRDGRLVVFARAPTRPVAIRAASLWAAAVDGTETRPLLAEDGVLDIPSDVSPDGVTLAFTRRRFEPRSRAETAIYVVRLDGSGLRKLADRALDPAWAPDGRSLAFASDRDQNGTLTYGDATSFATELYVADADGANARRLTRTEGVNERSPTWSPDGTGIAFERGRVIANAEGKAVFVVSPDGTNARPLAAHPRLKIWYARPVWRPAAPRRAR